MDNEEQLGLIVGSNIKYYLGLNQMSQRELAEKLGVSETSVGNWCSGAKIPRIDKVDRMCKLFDCRRANILSERPSMDNLVDITKLQISDPELTNALRVYVGLTPDKKKHVLDTIYMLGKLSS